MRRPQRYSLVMLALLLAPAWAGTWTLQLPADQPPSEWEDALELTGMRAAAPGEDAHAQIRCADGDCELLIRDDEGWRATAIPAPSSPADREQIALKARSMLLARAEIHNEWRPALGDFLADEPAPPPPPPLPTFELSPPTLSEYPRSEPLPDSHIPVEEAYWSPALQPSVLISSPPRLTLWAAFGAAGERRSTDDFGIGAGAAGGVAMRDDQLGAGLELTGHSPSRFSAERGWSTWGVAGAVWWRPAARLQVTGVFGGHQLRFTESGRAADAVQRAFAAAEVATPLGPVWLTLRFTTALSPVTLYEVDQLGRETTLAELGTLRSGQLGVRWFLGR